MTSSRDASIRAWTPKGALITSVIGHDLRVNSLSVDKSGDYFFSASDDKTIKRWSSSNFSIVSTYRGNHDYALSVATAKDGFSFVSGGENGSLIFWQTESKVRQYYGKMDAGIYDLTVSSDGKKIAAAVGSGTQELAETLLDPHFADSVIQQLLKMPRSVSIFDRETGKLDHILRGHQSGINAIALAPNGQFSVSASDDSTAIIWRLNGDFAPLVFHKDKVNAAAISSDSKWIALTSDDSVATIWSDEGKKQAILKGATDKLSDIGFIENNTIVTTDLGGLLRFWTVKGDTIRHIDVNNGMGLLSLRVSANKKFILVGDVDTSAFLYNAGGHLLKIFNISERNKAGTNGVYTSDFSPDGKLVAFGSGGGFIKIFTKDGQLLQTIFGKNRGFYSLRFSSDGKRIYAGCGDGFVRVYDNLTQ